MAEKHRTLHRLYIRASLENERVYMNIGEKRRLCRACAYALQMSPDAKGSSDKKNGLKLYTILTQRKRKLNSGFFKEIIVYGVKSEESDQLLLILSLILSSRIVPWRCSPFVYHCCDFIPIIPVMRCSWSVQM